MAKTAGSRLLHTFVLFTIWIWPNLCGLALLAADLSSTYVGLNLGVLILSAAKLSHTFFISNLNILKILFKIKINISRTE